MDKLLEEEQSDPVLAMIKSVAPKAVNVIIRELNDYEKDNGATAATRIRAAESILDRAGYNGKQEEAKGSSILLNLSSEQLKALINPQPIKDQPDVLKD